MRALFPRRQARAVVTALLVLKMAIAVWNTCFFPPRGGYDPHWHVARTVVAGLKAGKMDYDPPLYYLLNLPFIPHDSRPSHEDVTVLMARIQWSNLVYLALFYVAWIYFVFPRVVPRWQEATVASVMLLALPGYQKLAVMVHPDNLFAAATAWAFACWLWIDWRRMQADAVGSRSPPVERSALLLLAALVVLTGLTRPFAVLPVALFSLLILRETWAQTRPSFRRFAALGAALMLLVGTVSSAWYVHRWRTSNTVLNAYNDSYVGPYQPLKKDFDFRHYFGSFYWREFLETPNRELFKRDAQAAPGKNRYANSFFSLAYSEAWGDEWLYFSGGYQERKLWAKRVLLVGAFPLTLFLGAAFPVGLLRAGWEALRQRRWVSPRTVAAAMTVGGLALYLWWQTGPALLPGKNSSVKFIYVAYLVPFVLATCLSFRMRRRAYEILMAVGLAVFVLSLPVAIYVPVEAADWTVPPATFP